MSLNDVLSKIADWLWRKNSSDSSESTTRDGSERSSVDRSVNSDRTVSGSSVSRSAEGSSAGSQSVVDSDVRRGDDTSPDSPLWDDERSSFNSRTKKETATGIERIVESLLLGLGIKGIGSAFSSFLGSSQSAIADNNSSQSSFWSSLKNALVGDGSNSSGLLNGLGSVLGGISTEIGSSILNYNNQVKLLDKQNEYNTPAAQMQRFADAGLNPNLIYGMGSNGNQPASGSIAPVDFSTASREAKMQMLSYKADLSQKEASINLMNKQADEASERARSQSLSNEVYMRGWFNQQMVTFAQYRSIINGIKNDNIRVGLEKDLNEAEVSLKEFMAQPEYMKQLGSVEDATSYVFSIIEKIRSKLEEYNKHHTDYDGVTYDRAPDMRGVGSTF